MKEEFYCLALRKKVTTKVIGVAKKKGYSLKGLYKEGGKEYKVTKTCSKAKAEEVAQKLGLDIEQQVVETKASESSDLESVVPADDFMPEGDGKVIGQNTAGVSTAIEGTEDTVTTNTTPLHAESESKDSDEDNIGPMSMASESEPIADGNCQKNNHLICIDCKAACLDCNPDAIAAGDICKFCSGESLERYDAQSNCACGCSTGSCKCPSGCKCGCTDISTGITHNSESQLGGGGMDYAIEPDHWLRLQAHPEWKEWAPEVNVSRESNYWVITCPDVSADDILELIIATADDQPFHESNIKTSGTTKGVTLGLGLIGLAASLFLLRNLGKGE